ncbi:9223_t:CDS:2 [Paraglomus brasilianum]|uniref:9223_t:CDS:1 n=1 Tax=Paraglomus brasilianum TaxID=144538 RepID=A0A9N8VTG6_9GLOM|nr:9223_t:CDS:2 [Paraglomus brasilianum]
MASSTEGKHGNRLSFGKGFGHDVRRGMVKIDPRLPDDLKNVVVWLKEEKDVISGLHAVISAKKEASKYFHIWGKNEEDDIADVAEKMSELMSKTLDVEIVFWEKYNRYRDLVKQIRDAEHRLVGPKDKKRRLTDELARLRKHQPQSPKIRDTELELKRATEDYEATKTDVGNVKRQRLREALTLLTDAMFETAEKVAIIAGFSWYLVDLIDKDILNFGERRRPYNGAATSSQVVQDCQVHLHRWQPCSTDIKIIVSTLTNTTLSEGAQQKQEYELRIAQLNSQLASQRQSYEAQIRDLTARLEDNQHTLSSKIEELSGILRHQKEGSQVRLDDLSAALTNQRAEYEAKIQDMHRALMEQKAGLDGHVNELNASLLAERQKNSVQGRDYHSAMAQKHEYEVRLREKDGFILSLQRDMNAVAAEKNRLSQLVRDFENMIRAQGGVSDTSRLNIESNLEQIRNQLASINITPNYGVPPGGLPHNQPYARPPIPTVLSPNVPLTTSPEQDPFLNGRSPSPIQKLPPPADNNTNRPGQQGPPPPPANYFQQFRRPPFSNPNYYQGPAQPPRPPGFVGGFFIPPDGANPPRPPKGGVANNEK